MFHNHFGKGSSLILAVFIFLGHFPIVVKAQEVVPIIPLPLESQSNKEAFFLDHMVSLEYDEELEAEVGYFRRALYKEKNIPLSPSNRVAKSRISVVKDTGLGNGYTLTVKADHIMIRGANSTQAFYGLVSLLQLIHTGEEEDQGIKIKGWEIRDRPNYEWRGIMLDESRHFFGVEKVKQVLDWMAFYKLNKFHWHLTDAPGWRLEVLQYPKLGLVGGIGNHTDPYTPSQFYTQEQIGEIVRYAAERKISVIPEIDMPGHATAANRAYPEYSGGGSERYPDFTFHPAKEETYAFLNTILKEVDLLFPSNMIHLGGDEVSFGNEQWPKDPEVLALMNQEGLKTLKEVEDYFFQRMSDSLFTRKNQVLAWDEMAAADLPKDNTLIMWWRHDKPEQLKLALSKGFRTIICPRIPFYFDFVQEEDHQYGRKWAGDFSPLEAVYTFDLAAMEVPDEQQDLIVGIQANVWTETIHNQQRLDYMLFPRIAAMAESAWSHRQVKNYAAFLQRLPLHLDLYQKEGLYYYHPFKQGHHPEPVYLP